MDQMCGAGRTPHIHHVRSEHSQAHLRCVFLVLVLFGRTWRYFVSCVQSLHSEDLFGVQQVFPWRGSPLGPYPLGKKSAPNRQNGFPGDMLFESTRNGQRRRFWRRLCMLFVHIFAGRHHKAEEKSATKSIEVTDPLRIVVPRFVLSIRRCSYPR